MRTPQVERSALLAVVSLLAVACGGAGPVTEPDPAASPAAVTPSASASATTEDVDGLARLPDVGDVTTVVASIDSASVGGVVLDDGALLLSDIGPFPALDGQRLLRVAVDANGEAGQVETVLEDAGLRPPGALALLPDGDILVAPFRGSQLLRVAPEAGTFEVVTSSLDSVLGLTVEGDTAIITECRDEGSALRRVELADGAVTTISEDAALDCPVDVLVDPRGGYHVANSGDGVILHIAPDGAAHPLAQLESGQASRMVRWRGKLLIADVLAHRIVALDLDGREFLVVAGSGKAGTEDGTAVTASFRHPHLLLLDNAGDLLVLHTASRRNANNPTTVRKVDLPD